MLYASFPRPAAAERILFMNVDHAKAMMDAFYDAKRIRDMLPPLPDGVTPSYIHLLDCVYALSENGKQVRVSDAADYLHLPRPVITRTVGNMENEGLIQKIPDKNDRRVVHIELTENGKKLRQRYVDDYFGALTKKFDDISDEEADAMIRTIRKVRRDLS